MSALMRWAGTLPDMAFKLACSQNAHRMWQGGNQWSAYDSFLSFFKDVVGLSLPCYSAYEHWQVLAERSGPRIVHQEFCMISDRPRKLTVDDQNRPHCEDGPFCEWRDGSALFAIHGVRVPAWIVEGTAPITISAIAKEGNAEVRRIMTERYPGGPGAYAIDAGALCLDRDFRKRFPSDDQPVPRALMQMPDKSQWLVGTDGSTERAYWMPVPATVKTCKEAHEAIMGRNEDLILTQS